MDQAESYVTVRRSLAAGIFSAVVAGILALLSVVWIRFGSFPLWLFPIALTLVEVTSAVIMLRPLHFRVVVDETGIRTEGHAAWTLRRHEIYSAGVVPGDRATLWAVPTGQLTHSRRGFNHSDAAPADAHLVPIDPQMALHFHHALVDLGFSDGSAGRRPAEHRSPTPSRARPAVSPSSRPRRSAPDAPRRRALVVPEPPTPTASEPTASGPAVRSSEARPHRGADEVMAQEPRHRPSRAARGLEPDGQDEHSRPRRMGR